MSAGERDGNETPTMVRRTIKLDHQSMSDSRHMRIPLTTKLSEEIFTD